MHILHLAAGAGQMYCGACARDLALLRGLMQLGHDVQIVPLYTPLRIEGDEVPVTGPVFMGGLNAYLQQHFALFRKLPRWLDRVLDSPTLLKLISRFAISTRPSQLGAMTVSVLSGPEGLQRKEFERLLDYLAAQELADVVSITNSLLSGIAPELKRRFGRPIICGFQGEDGFIEAMGEPYSSQAWQLLRRNAQAVDLFIAPGTRHAEQMAERLNLNPERVRVVPTPLDAEQYRREAPRVREPFTVAYLSVITPLKGLDLLVEACARLLQSGVSEIRLCVAGRVLDPKYWAGVQRQVAAAGLTDRFEYLGEVDMEGKRRLLHECSVFALPTRAGEARGVAAMEAMAAGVPVVVPDAGVFPELIGATGGGELFAPADAGSLAQALRGLIDDPDRADALGAAAAKGIAMHYGQQAVTRALLKALESVVAR